MNSKAAARSGGVTGGAVGVVNDPFDDHAVTAAVLDRHNRAAGAIVRAAGAIVVHPTPGRSNSSLAMDILVALGHDISNLAGERIGAPAIVWTAATAWCDAAAHAGILHLVVLRGHLLTPAQLERFTALHSAVDMQLTVIWHARIPPRADLFGRTGYRIVDDLDDVFGPPAVSPSAAPTVSCLEDRSPLPAVPMLDPDRFPGAIENLMSRVDAERVLAIYDHGRQEIGRRLGTDPDVTEALSVLLTALVTESPSDRHTVALLQGAQRGFADHGYHLDLPSELPYMVGPGLTTDPFTTDTGARIYGRLAHPVRAGVLATTLFTGVSYSTLTKIPLEALSESADVLRLDSEDRGGAVAVPDSARPLLLAARSFQLQRGAEPSSALFRGGLGGEGRFVRDSADACGLTLPARHRWDRQWPATVAVSTLAAASEISVG